MLLEVRNIAISGLLVTFTGYTHILEIFFLLLEIFGVAKSIVVKTCQKYSKSQNYDSKARCGRPRKLNERQKRFLVSNLRTSPSKTSLELSNEISDLTKESVSASCIRRNLLQLGLRSYVARKKPYINEKAVKNRLAWCKAHQNLPKEFWQNILFSDETIIEIHPFNAMNRIRRFSFENPYQKKYICPKVKCPNIY